MANAAAKKAAIARKQTASFYRPLLLAINLLFIALTYKHRSDESPLFQTSTVLWTCLQCGLTLFAYSGILEDASNNAGTNDGRNKLAGGMYLDLLGLVVFTQFAGLYLSQKIRWAVVVVPIAYGILKLRGFVGGVGGGDGEDEGVGETSEVSDAAKDIAERRRKRSERRRQKRG